MIDRFRRLIAATGPVSVAQFMAESNAHYYDSRDPLGTAGDFITAPEISQMFGELVGLWLADVWTRAGSPPRVHYIEFGPGRGTLARDALGAARRFGLQPHVHFVEASRTLGAAQAERVPGAQCHHDPSTLPDDAPLLIVANEFFDALPVRQLVRTAKGWRERLVGLEGDRLVPMAGAQPMDAALADDPAALLATTEGTIIETAPAAAALMREIAGRLAAQGGAALVIDYGRTLPATGSTLQALRAHRPVDPFAHPGEADLTAHVDFAMLARVAAAAGAQVAGMAEQGAFLGALGLGARAGALIARHPDRTREIEAAVHRLAAPEAMGRLFKVLGLGGRDWPQGACFTR